MSDHDDDSALYDQPIEFMTSIANSGGYHDGQSIIPEEDHYICTCSCGTWTVQAPDQMAGVWAAREHTTLMASRRSA